MLQSLLNNIHSKLSALLRPGREALSMRLSNREKKHHHKTLRLLDSLWHDLACFSKFIKSVDFQYDDNFKVLDKTLASKVDTNSYKGKLEFLSKNEFLLSPLMRPFLSKLYKFLEMFFSLFSSSLIDTSTKTQMIKTALKASLGNPFVELSKTKRLKHIPINSDLQMVLLKFVKTQLKYVREYKNSVLSIDNFQIIKLALTFFSQLKQVFIFNADECLEALTLSCARLDLRFYILDRLVSLKTISKHEVKTLMSFPASSLTRISAFGNFGFYKNLLANRHSNISTSELSILTLKIATSMNGGDDLKFNSFSQIALNVIKAKYKAENSDFTLNLILDPMLVKLKDAFRFMRKKTRGLSPKILEKYLIFLCSLTGFEITKLKDKSASEAIKTEDSLEAKIKEENNEEANANANDNDNKIVEETPREASKPAAKLRSKITKEIVARYNGILTTFATESVFLLLISKFSEKYLLPVLIENLCILDETFPSVFISRLDKFLQMENINMGYFLTSIYWILDWLFEQSQFELIAKIFKGASAAISRLDKLAKKKVFQVCFYILFRVSTLQNIIQGNLQVLPCLKSTRFVLDKICISDEFDQEYEDRVNDVLACENVALLAQKVKASPFSSSLFILLESYPDLFESFAKESESLSTCFYTLFPPKLHLNEDYCLEPENVKKILDLITEQIFKKQLNSEGHWHDDELRFILRKISELYPKAFKSWLKKFIEKNLKLVKKAKMEGNDVMVLAELSNAIQSRKDYSEHVISLLKNIYSEEDLLLDDKNQHYKVAGLFGSTKDANSITKLRKFGISLYIVTIIDFKAPSLKEFIPFIQNLSLSFFGLSEQITFPAKLNIGINLLKHPVFGKGVTEGLSAIINTQLPVLENLFLDDSISTPHMTLISKFIQSNLSILSAMMCSHKFIPDSDWVTQSILKLIFNLTAVIKLDCLTSKQEKLFTNFLLFISQASENNFSSKPLKFAKQVKYIKKLPLEKHPLSRSIYKLLENDYFKRKVYQTVISIQFPYKNFVKFLGYSLRLHYKHFDVSRGNILALFAIVSNYKQLGKKLMSHVLAVSRHWLQLIFKDSAINLLDYKTIINAFIKEENHCLQTSMIKKHFLMLQFLVDFLDREIAYEEKLVVLERCKDLNDVIFEYSEIANSMYFETQELVVEPVNNEGKPADSTAIVPETSPKREVSLLEKLITILADPIKQNKSQTSKFLHFLACLNQYKGKAISKSDLLAKINSNLPNGPKTNLDYIQYLLALSEIKKKVHNPQIKRFTSITNFFETVDSSKKISANFSSSSNLNSFPLRVKFLPHQKQKVLESPNAGVAMDLFKFLTRKMQELLASQDCFSKKMNNISQFYKYSKYSVQKARGGHHTFFGNSSSYPEYHLYYNLLLKLVKSFRFNMKPLFKYLADVICSSKPVSQSWIFLVVLVLSFRLRNLVNYKFDLLLLYGLTRLLTVFTPKNAKLFFQLGMMLKNSNTISFSPLNCMVSYFEKFILLTGGAYHPKHIKNFEVPTTAQQNPEALLYHLMKSIEARAEPKTKSANAIKEEEEEEGQAMSEVKRCNSISPEALLENTKSMITLIYSLCIGYAPYALKSRTFKIVRSSKLTPNNVSGWQTFFMMYANSLPLHSRVMTPRIDELDDLPESEQKLFKRYHCILRGVKRIVKKQPLDSKPENENKIVLEVKKVDESLKNDESIGTGTETDNDTTHIEGEEIEVIPDEDQSATKDVLAYLEKDPEQEDNKMMTPKLKKPTIYRSSFNLREMNYKVFKASIQGIEESGENLKNLSVFLISIFRFENFCYEHLKVILPKLRNIFNAEQAKEESEKSGFLADFRKLSESLVPSLMIKKFREHRKKIVSLFLSEFQKSKSIIFRQFILHVLISVSLREYSKSNCEMLIESLPRFLDTSNFLMNQFVYQRLSRLVTTIWPTSFEVFFTLIMDQIESVLELEDSVERNLKGNIYALLFCACLTANRKPNPEMLKRILKTILLLIRRDLKDRTYIDKSRDSLKNYNEVLKPQIDLDCYQYDKTDVKHLLELSGGLNYFA